MIRLDHYSTLQMHPIPKEGPDLQLTISNLFLLQKDSVFYGQLHLGPSDKVKLHSGEKVSIKKWILQGTIK